MFGLHSAGYRPLPNVLVVTTIPEKERGYDPGSVDKKKQESERRSNCSGHLTPGALFLFFVF